MSWSMNSLSNKWAKAILEMAYTAWSEGQLRDDAIEILQHIRDEYPRLSAQYKFMLEQVLGDKA